MPADHSLALRRAVVAHLAADAGIGSIVGARVYGEAVPDPVVWPFVRVGLMLPVPFEATCLDGMEATFAVSGFAKGPDAQNAYGLGALIQLALDGADLALSLDAAHAVSIDWTTSQTVRDTGEADAYQAIVQFNAVTAADY